VAVIITAGILSSLAVRLDARQLYIGAASVNITPSRPVALAAQHRMRISREIESPLTATAVAIETRDGDKVLDQAIMVSCDLTAIMGDMQERFRKRVKARLGGFEISKLFLSGTQTHTAPELTEGLYPIPKEGVMRPTEYVRFLMERLEDVVVRAWKDRRVGGVGWGLGHALVAHNRRAVYADGRARIYGRTDTRTFRGLEGYEDHYVDVLFFFNPDRKPIALAVNLACPAQEVENRQTINADFWHEARLMLRKRFGKDIQVLGWTGAAGNQSSHLMWYTRAEERMRKLRGLTRLEEIARRIDLAVGQAYEGAKKDIRFDVPLIHRVKDIRLPVRMVTQKEFARARKSLDALVGKQNLDTRRRLERSWSRGIVARYQRQKTNPYYTMELHAIRLGDVAVCTNEFVLFTEYGVRIKARSKAVQTFIIQLAGTCGDYIPTAEAIRGGSYSTAVFSNQVGPKGGNVLVDRTVETINSMWEKSN